MSALYRLRPRVGPSLLLLLASVALALVLAQLTLPEPAHTDRPYYERMGANPLAPDCDGYQSMLCPRVLAPVMAASLPVPNETAWRLQGLAARAATGFVMGLVMLKLTGRWEAGLAAVVLTQGSFGLAYTVYDPWSADPLVYLLSGLFALAWFWDLPWLAIGAGIIGGFTKQSPMVVAGCLALASLIPRLSQRWRWWVAQAGVAVATQLAVSAVVQQASGAVDASRSSTLQLALSGGWLALQIREIGPGQVVYYALAAFGLGAVCALLGLLGAPRRVWTLAAGSVLPFVVLCELQGDLGRSLGNAFFIVVPLEVLCLLRLPAALRWLAILTNVLFVLRVGQTAPQLPSSQLLIIPSVLVTAMVVWWYVKDRVPVTRLLPLKPSVP